MTSTQFEKANRFRALHQAPGFFVIANAWDAGSARILTGLGFQALAHGRPECDWQLTPIMPCAC
jgi:2-methylisocitrate lyase-like PEP mutase family enzyme